VVAGNALRTVVAQGGFTRFRHAVETPLNRVLWRLASPHFRCVPSNCGNPAYISTDVGAERLAISVARTAAAPVERLAKVPRGSGHGASSAA
jgi:hypothetical protein